MKKVLSLLLIMVLLTGCFSEEKDKKKEETGSNVSEKGETENKFGKNEALVIAKKVLAQAKVQYDKNVADKTYVNAGTVGSLPGLDKVYTGVWYLDEDSKTIMIKDVEIEGYLCTGDDTVMECKDK